MKKFLIAGTLAMSLSGCAHMHTRAIAYKNSSPSQLYVWGSQYSAGIGSHGKFCAQAATTARATGASAEATANSALLSAITPHVKDLPPQEAARMAGALQQNVMLTNATNGQTAFANIAFFYLCQISLNSGEKLQASDIRQMWKEVLQTVPNVGVSGEDTPQMNPSPPNIPFRPSETRRSETGNPDSEESSNR